MLLQNPKNICQNKYMCREIFEKSNGFEYVHGKILKFQLMNV